MQTVQLLTPAKASEIYGIPENELLLMAKSGKIRHYYFGRKMIRFSHDQILKYIYPSHLTEEEEKQLAKEREEEEKQLAKKREEESIQEEIESKRRQKEREYEEWLNLVRAYDEAFLLYENIREGKDKKQLQELIDHIHALNRARKKVDKIEKNKLIYDFNMRIAAIFVKRKKYKKILEKSPHHLSNTRFELSPYITRVKRLWYSRNRRAKIDASDETITTKDWIDICERWGNKCLCCGKPGNYLTLTLDHVFPLIDGGQHKKNNIQPLCKSCNSRKGAKYIDYRQ
jgi:5-methylcytosine-specific restriction endonuclease McrA